MTMSMIRQFFGICAGPPEFHDNGGGGRTNMTQISAAVILLAITITAQAGFAAFTHTFENDIVGNQPAQWGPIFGSTTATFTVQDDGGPNKFARQNDADSASSIDAYR